MPIGNFLGGGAQRRGGLGFQSRNARRPVKPLPGPLGKVAPGGKGRPDPQNGVTPLPRVIPNPMEPNTGGAEPVPGGGLNYMGGSPTFNENTGMGAGPTKTPMPLSNPEMTYGLPVMRPGDSGPNAKKPL